MEFRRRAIAVGITFFLAAATGHLMQNADAIATMLSGDARPTGQVLTHVEPTVGTLVAVEASTIVSLSGSVPNNPVTSSDDLSEVLPDFPAAEPAAFGNETFLAKRIKLIGDNGAAPGVPPDNGVEIFGFRCGDSSLQVDARPSAMLHVTLSAPCHPYERVVFQHSGLAFAMTTNASGSVDVMVPALSWDGEVTVNLLGDVPLAARDAVADLGSLTRIAVQAGRVPGLHLKATQAKDSFLTVLGDPDLSDPLVTEVYSVPKGIRRAAPQLEATVMEANCGRIISAMGFQTANGATPESTLIKVAMPGCDGLGDVVVMSLDPAAMARVAAAN